MEVFVVGTREPSGSRIDSVAIVGISCRLPGAGTPEEFWTLLAHGASSISDPPPGRWESDDISVRRGGFLDRVAGFDAGFFGISPREAASMDPQQRLMLELGWTALEDAGIVPGTLAGSRTGVFVGAMNCDYATMNTGTIDRHTVTGISRGLLANRISYALGLRGPSLTVDSAQSSSLVATHLACQSLRLGESDLVLAGGVNLNLSSTTTVSLERFGALSPTGLCHTFDEDADGYVRGEGGAMVVLKPLAAALADGNRIYCVINGSAVNNDGGGEGLTVPDADAQTAVLRDAYATAGVDPASVQYIELHGTGTKVGDPIEASAAGAALGTAPGRRDPLLVGSAKTNVGHLEGASGVVGLVKVALALREREIPASLNFSRPASRIPFEDLNLRVVQQHTPWPEGSRVAGVSSFGMGGTNCHVVLSGVDISDPDVTPSTESVLMLSAATPAALQDQARAVSARLEGEPDPGRVARALATTRTHFPHRAAITTTAPAEALGALVAGDPHASLLTGHNSGSRVAFMFTGQGAQRLGMGRELHEKYPVFARAYDEALLYLNVPAASSQEELDQTGFAQPELFALQVALYRLLEHLGVRPDVLVGHSVGEIAAAHVAGVLSLADAAALVRTRARLIQSLPGDGAMVALPATEDEVLPLLTRGVSIAAVNTGHDLVISGITAEVLAIAEKFPRHRRLAVSHAFHSPLMDPILAKFQRAVRKLAFHAPAIPIVTATTGKLATTDQLTDPRHWTDHISSTVRFSDAISTLGEQQTTHYVELGPDATLTTFARRILDGQGASAQFSPTLRRNRPEVDSFTLALAQLHVHSATPDWTRHYPRTPHTPLPTYPFQHEDAVVQAKPRTETRGLGELVRSHAAAVLGHASAADVRSENTFKESGFDSLSAVELASRLSDATGIRLPSTVVYEYPTPALLAEHLSQLESPSSVAVEVRQNPVDEPIAIVGMGCRLPGGVASPDDLWQLLANGTDAITGFPTDRGWDVQPGTTFTQEGGFLSAVADFDPAFFNISPREALAMDPQQRLLLETTWHALESAGIDPVSLRGSDTGVFVGATSSEYGPQLHHTSPDLRGYALTGTTMSVASGRIAYTFGLQGPAITVDTACSSSLVALHLACQALRQNDCGVAIAGGATVMATAGMFIEFSSQHGLAPDGRCKPFSSSADGTAWGEGVGVVVLQRLSDAIEAGHPILAVIRGTATNQDGATNGLAAPNGLAQQRVIRRAAANAGLALSDVDAVEAHGTGTTLGDPIEANALIATYGQDRDRPLWLGSVKSNIGHTQAAAGIAGVIKMVLAMGNGILPSTLHVDEPSSHVDWSAGQVRLLTEPVAWTTDGRPRRAAVSSFGISGTNAHAIIEQYDHIPAKPTPAPSGPTPVVLSAKSRKALLAQARQISAALAEHPVHAVAHSLAARSLMPHRAVAISSYAESLAAFDDGVVTGVAGEPGKVAFVYPGQGSQWTGMAVDLMAESPVFAARLSECAAALAPHVDWSLTDVLRDEQALKRVDVVQPALWAVMVSLTALWESYGLVPDAVVGHSQGEIAAACVAGALSLADAARVVALRSQVILALSGLGGMLSVALPADQIPLTTGLGVAAINGPSSTIISGDQAPLVALAESLKSQGVRARMVPVDYASHSAHVEAIQSELAAALGGITPLPPTIPMLSTVDGEWVEARLDAGYWYENLRRTVMFEPAIRSLGEQGFGTFVEISAHPVVGYPIAEIHPNAIVGGTLQRDDGGLQRFLISAAELVVRGVPVNLSSSGYRVPLPLYPFDHRRFWLAPSGAVDLPDSTIDEPESAWSPTDMLDLVCARTAATLGHDDPGEIEITKTFKELGFESLSAVRLRDQLAAATGLSLPPTLVFNHPTPAALAEFLRDQLGSKPLPVRTAPVKPVVVDDDAIAIVAMGCRLPGGVNTPEDLWRLLIDETDAITPFPADRGWDAEISPGEGGFLMSAADFDPAFFGIGPREALAMDPQQRLLLETTWHTLEQAGIVPDSLRDSDTGVFIGATNPEYGPRLHDASEDVCGHVLTGTSASVTSGRLAYTFGLRGPAITVDTACSSSLVALHLACQSLANGDCGLAIAGGATVMATPGLFLEFSRQQGLAPDGRCKPFSSTADGTAWAEGIGVLLLEKLSDAVRNNHPVLAVIRATASNQDGASNGLTAPSGQAQQQVIRRALASARLSAADVDVIEAHGTGTTLGDPIEAEALLATYGQDRSVPLVIGSLKSNVGHTQAAAGIAGVIKMVLAMQHGTVPKTLHIKEPTTHVDWSSGNASLADETSPWPSTDRVRRAAVSAFGLSGTNAHAILEQAPDIPRPSEPTTPMPLLLSAKSVEALHAQAAALIEHTGPTTDYGRLASALATTRTHFTHRAAVASSDPSTVQQALDALAQGQSHPHLVQGSVPTRPGSLVFQFTGQGSQRLDMGRALYSTYPVFASAYDEVLSCLSLPAVVTQAELDQTQFTQPALFALQVALFRLVESFGVRPSYLVGHSVGEISAAHVSGVLGLSDACALVTARASLIQSLPSDGAMYSVTAAPEDVLPFLSDTVALAAVNSSSNVVISGSASSTLAVASQFARHRRLPVSHAFHSPLMTPILDSFHAIASSLTYHPPTIPIVSTVTGQLVSSMSAQYWTDHIHSTVRYADAIQTLDSLGAGHYLELGPDATLTALTQRILDRPISTALLRRGQPETTTFSAALGRLHTSGVSIDWPGHSTVPLPPYPFQHSHFWLTSPRFDHLQSLTQDADLATFAARLGVSPDAPLSEVLPALLAWTPPATTPDPTPLPTPGLGIHIASLPEPDQYQALLDLVCGYAATALGHDSTGPVETTREFTDIGFASLTALDLRNKLSEAVGIDLPPTMIYDYPTPADLAFHLVKALTG